MKRPVRITLIVLASLLLLGVVAIISGEMWLKMRVRRVLASQTPIISGQPYRLSAERVGVNIFRMGVSLYEVEFMPADGEEGSVPPQSARAGKLSVTGIRYRQDGDKPSVRAGRLLVESPRIAVNSSRNPGPERGSLEKMVTKHFSGILVGEVSIEDANIDVVTNGRTWSVSGLDFTAENFSMDGRQISGRVLFSETVEMSASELTYMYKDGAMAIELEDVSASSGEGSLSAGSFRMTPRYPMREYATKVPGHPDWTKLELYDVAASGVDYAGLLGGKIVKAGKLTVGGGILHSYKDQNLKRTGQVKFIYESVRDIGFLLDIPAVEFADMEVRYEELPEGGSAAGVLIIDGLEGRITGLTNDAAPSAESYCLEATGNLMGAGRLQAMMCMPAGRSEESWEMSGTLGPMPMALLNPVTEPLASLQITSGEIDSLEFSIRGDSESARGMVTLAYEGLSVEVLQDGDPTRARPLMTWIAGEVLIPDSNPGRDGILETGQGRARRDVSRSQFNLMVRTIIDAIKEIIL